MKKTGLLLLLLIAGLCAGAQSIPCLPGSLSTGIIAFYPFGSGSLADASGGGHTLNNSTSAYPTTDRFGSPQCAYHFNAASGDKLNIAFGAATTFVDNITTAPFSISLWYQPIGPRASGAYELLIGRNSSPVHCPDTHGEWSIGLYDCRKAVAGFDMYNEWQTSTSTNCAAVQAGITGSWHHLVCTFDGTTRSLYVDNLLYPGVGGPCGSMAGNIGDLLLGEGYTGDLDDIIIYNRSLSASEVASLFNAGSCCGTTPPPCTQLPGSLGTGVMAFYPFGYGSLTDQSGGGNNLLNPTAAYPTMDRFGNPTCAYHFDKSSGDFLTIPFGGGPSFIDNITSGPFSVSLWYQPMGPRGAGLFEQLMGRNTGGHCPDTYGEWSIGLYDCRKAVVGFDQYSLWQTTTLGCPGFQASVTGSWHHLAFVYDGTTRSLYVDNVLFSTLSGPCGPMAGNVGDFFMGIDYTGDLDDIVMYNRALTPAEVTSLYTMTTACCDTTTTTPVTLACNTLSGSLGAGVMSFYPFGNGSLLDVSGGGHHLMNTTTAYPTMDRSGNPTCAYHFDKVNGDFLSMTASGSTYLDNMTTSPFSISLWYQPIGPRGGGDYELLVGRNTGLHCPDTYGEWSIGLYDCRQAVAGFDQYNEWQNVAGSYGSCNACIAALSGSWHHLVCIYDGTNRYLYIDAALFSVTGGPCGAMSGNIGQLLLGTDYTGDLDDVIFYNRALSLSEVLTLYKMPGSCCDGQTSSSKGTTAPATHSLARQGTGITIYPNPSGGMLTIDGNINIADKTVQIEVVDLLGRPVYTTATAVSDGRINMQINLSSAIANGVYLIKVKGDNTNEVLRFTIKR